MKAAMQFNTYAELKPLYEEATEYYYSMDIVGENIDEYVALYEELRVKIAAIEGDSSMFVAIVNGSVAGEEGKALADMTDKTELYVALNACYAYTENLDDTYDILDRGLLRRLLKNADVRQGDRLDRRRLGRCVRLLCGGHSRGNIRRRVDRGRVVLCAGNTQQK